MTAPDTPLDRSKPAWIDAIIVALVTLAVFLPILRGAFSPIDDQTMLRDNPKYLSASFGALIEHWTQPDFRIYAPIPYSVWHGIALFSTHSESAQTETLSVIGFKIASWITHAGAAVAAWWALTRLTRTRIPALLGALVVALHPVQVESVAWTTGLKDILGGLFVFLSIGFYAGHLRTSDRRAWVWSFVMAILAMLSKPSAMVLPLMLAAVDFCLVQRPLDKRLASLAPLVLPAMGIGLIMMVIQSSAEPYDPFWSRPIVALDALAFYLGKLVLPIHLIPDYGRTPTYLLQTKTVYWTWIVPVLLAVIVVFRGSSQVKLAAALFVLPLTPVLGLVPFDMQQYSTVADHYLYPAMVGAGLAIAALMESCSFSRWIVVVVVISLGAIAHRQAQAWTDLENYFDHVVQINPRSALGHSVISTLALERGDFDRAETEVRLAISMRVKARYYSKLCQILVEQKRFPEAADAGNMALDEGLYDTVSLRKLLILATRMNNRELAERTVVEWLKIEPDNLQMRQTLKVIRAAASQPASRPASSPAAP